MATLDKANTSIININNAFILNDGNDEEALALTYGKRRSRPPRLRRPSKGITFNSRST